MKNLTSVIILIIITAFTALSACSAEPTEISPDAVTAFVKTQTAKAWTPTPSPTHKPDESKILGPLNNAGFRKDPLADELEARYRATKIDFLKEDGSKVFVILQIEITCENPHNKPVCTPERAFIILVHALEDENIRTQVLKQVPDTIKKLVLIVKNHDMEIGQVKANWKDLIAYTKQDGSLPTEEFSRSLEISP